MLLQLLINAQSEDNQGVFTVGDSKEELLDDFHVLYRFSIIYKSSTKSIVGDIERMLASKVSDEAGRIDVGYGHRIR